MSVNTITRVYFRTYSDSGQTKLYVEWSDGSRTECDAKKAALTTHVRALVDRAKREGLKIERETW